MTKSQFDRADIAFREELRREELDRFHVLERRRLLNATGFARRAADARKARDEVTA